jgi:gamma-butyrobetaine dioxygenase
MAATEAAARRIALPRPTLYGEGMWQVVVTHSSARLIDTAYTPLPLPLHTDGLYLADPPGLQCFHALVPDATGGGRTTLLDGAAAARAVRATSPSSFDYLSQAYLPFHHTDAQAVVHARQRVLTLGEGGEVDAVAWNADDRAPYTGSLRSAVASIGDGPSPAALDVLTFYASIRPWLAALADPAHRVEVSLAPGDLLIFDNTRVLHGRTPVDPTSGRVLAGCYHAREDWHSRMRVLTRRLGASG